MGGWGPIQPVTPPEASHTVLPTLRLGTAPARGQGAGPVERPLHSVLPQLSAPAGWVLEGYASYDNDLRLLTVGLFNMAAFLSTTHSHKRRQIAPLTFKGL